jgi:phage repressor protein C with HTH and peptisase S24 domain
MQALDRLPIDLAGAACAPMGTIHDVRRANLQYLFEHRFNGKKTDMGRAVERDDAQVWQWLFGRRDVGEKLARSIESSLRLPVGALDQPMGAQVMEPGVIYDTGTLRVPVVGTAELGDNGFHTELDYPVGHGDGFIAYPTSDPNAYALRVKGDSMRPRIKPGEFVLIEPNTAPQPGEEVLVRTRDGRVMVKVLDFQRNGVVQLSSVNEEHRPMTLEATEIERLHYVAAIVKAAMYYRGNT